MDIPTEVPISSTKSNTAKPPQQEFNLTNMPASGSTDNDVPPDEEINMITPAATPTGTETLPASFPSDAAYDYTSEPEDDATAPAYSDIDNLEPRDLERESGIGGVPEDFPEDEEYVETEEEEEEEKKTKKQLVVDYGKYLHKMEDRVAFLEKTLHDFESDGQDLKAKKKAKATKRVPAIPELHRIEWHQFKNRHRDEKDVYAIDVLIGNAEFYYQRRKDKHRRKRRLDTMQGSSTKDPSLETERRSGAHTELPERIRINSLPLLSILAEIISRDAWTAPVVFLRPYKVLTKHFDEIKQYYTYLENKWCKTEEDERASTESAQLETTQDGKTDPEALPQKTDSSETSEDLADSLEALKDLRCLVDFMDKELKPVIDRVSAESNTKVQFHELWHLFKPGDELYAPVRNKTTNGTVQQPSEGSLKSSAEQSNEVRSQTTFICIQAMGGRPYLSADDDEDTVATPKKKVSSFWVRCFYVEYYGKEFGPVRHDFEILPFSGGKEITALEVYPLKFSRNGTKIKSHLVERGNKFRSFTSTKHQMYSGRTLTLAANGGSIGAGNGKPTPKFIEHVKGRVVVDFKTAISSTDWYILPFSIPGDLPEEWRSVTEEYPLQIWKDHDQKDLDTSLDEYIYDDDHIDRELRSDYVAKDPFLTTYADRTDEDLGSADELTDRELMLLPNGVYAYILRSREFAILDIDCLRDVKPDREGLDSLKLPKGHKGMVQALVKTHFREKSFQKGLAEEQSEIDVVQGKGKGLIILLHGAPGVGKTSTAECVAESSGKPLFPITCGDLGITAEEVENSLEDKFKLAQRWDCVLLLDEADVFLAQRTKTDLKRNTLVSVFLRVLEYYTGILFLTTNRVGAFDEAFKSRIHISLYYPPLEEEQTKSIWKMNLGRTLERKKGILEADEQELLAYATSHYRSSFAKKAAWNGRQIRNAFQTAAALAEFEAHEKYLKTSKDDQNSSPKPIARLEKRHFEIVAEATLQFDLYIAETVGRSDAERAYQMMERADQFRWTARSKATFGDSRPPPENIYPDHYRSPTDVYYTPQSEHDPSRRPRQLRPYQGQVQPGTPTPPPPMSGGYPPSATYGMHDAGYKRDRQAQYSTPWQQESMPPSARGPPPAQQPQQDPRYGLDEGVGNEDEDGW